MLVQLQLHLNVEIEIVLKKIQMAANDILLQFKEKGLTWIGYFYHVFTQFSQIHTSQNPKIYPQTTLGPRRHLNIYDL